MSEAAPDPERPTGPPSSVLGGRLAADGPPPKWADLGLEAARQAAFDWQEQRSRAQWNELVVLTRNPAASDWVNEIHGLIGVVGELVLVCIEAEVEKEILRRHIAELPSNTTNQLALRAAAARSLRFFAEGQGNELTVAGHTLANLTLRTLTLHPAFDIATVAPVLELDAGKYTPGSRNRNAWIMLTSEKAVVLLRVAATLGCPELVSLAEALKTIAVDPVLLDLSKLRNVQYHRWRGESPGVTGINFNEEPMSARLQRGEAIGFRGELLPDYLDGQAVLDQVVATGRAALDALASYLPSFLETWHAGFVAAIP